MTADFIRNIVESARDDLASHEAPRLEKKLVELEEKCCRSSSDKDRDDLLKLLSVRLVKEAIQTRNAQLCLLALKKLDLHRLITLLNPEATSLNDTILELVSNYFQIGTSKLDEQGNEIDGYSTKGTANDLAREGGGGLELDRSAAQAPVKQLAQLEAAQNNETEENFGEALSLYELCGTRYSNFVRVSMKHLMCASHDFLQKYCADRVDLRPIWFNYLLECKRYKDAVNFCESTGDKLSGLLIKSAKLQKGNKLHELLPNDVYEFALTGASKWTNKRRLDTVLSVANNSTYAKGLLAELTTYYLKSDHLNMALSVALSFNCANLVLDQYLTRYADHPISLNSVSRFGAIYFNNSHLLYHLISVMCYNLNPHRDIIRSVCINLGLLDELIRMTPRGQDPSDPLLGHLLERLERIIEYGLAEQLNTIDPLLEKSTMASMLRYSKQEDERDMNVQLITILLLVINIFLLKLDPNKQNITIDMCVSKLEYMFEYLSEYLDELTFSASDGLIRATNNLVIAIKSKLDALADSAVIRDSFMKIVDKIAGLCLIDARYKSAAILYSQIEDNVNAIKALMRTGEADTVMNYALLVRDITVNRITINYIKHLRLEPEIIEDFIRRSKL